MTQWTEVLGWMLLHSLWQGALAGALLAVALAALRRHGAVIRYAAACTAMLLMAALPLLTGLRLVLDPGTLPLDSDLLPRWRAAPWVGEWVRWFVPFWAAGVAVQAGRLWLGLARTRKLRRAGVCAAPREWRAAVHRIGERLGIQDRATLLESTLVDVPSVAGCLRPFILLPVGAFRRLARAQGEMILAHELAHIRRRDPLANLIQSSIEAVLFYHPVVWWISACVRQEREYCCDEIAVALHNDPLGYARSLAGLEKLRQEWPLATVGAGGGSLPQRVRRLTMPPAASRKMGSLHWLSLGAGALAVLLIGSAQGARATPGYRPGPYGAKPQPPPVLSSAVIDEIAPEPLEAMPRFDAEHAWVLPGR